MDVFMPMRGGPPLPNEIIQSHIPSRRPAGVGKVSSWDSLANVNRAVRSRIGHEKLMDRPTTRSPSRNLRKSKAHARKANSAATSTGVIPRAQKLDISRPARKGKGAIAKIQKRVMWSIATRLQIIEAVINVEEELLLARSKGGVSPSVGRGVKKWSRVAELLSEEFRVHSRGPEGSLIGRYKCKSVFDHLIRGYKDKISGRNRKSSHSLRLTDEEFLLLKSREDNKARFLHASGKSSKRSLQRNLRSHIIKQSEEDSSDRESSGSATEQGGICSVTEHQSDSESNEAFGKLLPIEGKTETTRSRWVSHHIDSEKMVLVSKTTEELGNFKTIGSRRGSYIDPARKIFVIDNSDALGDESSMIKRADGEDLRDIFERPLQRVDAGFLRLSSWAKKDALPFAESLTNASTSPAMSAKKRKVNAFLGPPGGSVTEAFEGLVKDSSNGITGQQIQALFQKLRIRFAEILKNNCVDIAKDIVEEPRLTFIPS